MQRGHRDTQPVNEASKEPPHLLLRGTGAEKHWLCTALMRILRGIEAVIGKDLCSELLARELEADVFFMATDGCRVP